MYLSIGSLFSGVGGLELGLEWSGLGSTVWQVEQDEFCRQVLAKHWPDADRSVTDVRSAGTATLVPVDVICGGFPCQDVSGAGKGAGLDGARSGLWWEYLRVADEMRPSIVIVENVASGAKRWLCPVRNSLHELGYRTRALGISAADVGAPHLRRRIFVVAYANSLRGVQQEGPEPNERGRAADGGTARVRDAVGKSGGSRRKGTVVSSAPGDWSLPSRASWREREAQPAVGRGAHGVPTGLDAHRWPAGRGQAQYNWEPPRLTDEKGGGRRRRIRALGNAVVPQCGYVVGLVVRQILGKE